MAQGLAVGDRVMVVNERLTGIPYGTLGTIIQVFARVPHICDVQFDGHAGEHAVLTRALALAPPDMPPRGA